MPTPSKKHLVCDSETKAGHIKLCIGLQGFVLFSLSRSHPLLQDNLNQCETEWCNHHFFSVRNNFINALLCLKIDGTGSASVSTSNKFWFGENLTVNSTLSCNYPGANKANTDITQTLNV